MKTNIITRFIICIGLLCVLSCEKELLTQADYSDYTFSSLDEKGGNWKTVLLSTANQIAIPVPKDVSSDDYKAELAALKTMMASLSDAQREAVDYWTNNPVLRWNEIALDMAAKYNLIPQPNPDGTYTLPDAANPGKYPNFPFAHPPYTCRALAYLSVAQFDGLISAWHYKYSYNRKAPYEVDNSIVPAYTKTGLPAYPADGAVVATASRDILTAMFPLEKEFLAAKAAEHLSSLTWAGVNVKSDVDAGATIGVEVAKIALQRAGNDGMKKAQTPKPVSDSIKAAAFKRFGWQWDNMESPVRPVGLAPLFGKVKMWNVPTVEEVRPPAPPVPGSAEFQVAARELQDYAKKLTTEQRKIANWWSDGLGTYTPPGHWNRFAKDFMIEYKFNPLRSARAFAYMNMAIMDAGISCWDAKYYYHYPRPIQAIPGFKTILGTPNFPAYTSGHSTFSAAAAEVLSYVFPSEAQQCQVWAREAAESRIYGGIHYRFDAEVGLTQGKNVAVYTVNKAKQDGAE
ncbi:phosphatase PAP2 family protein [Haliscomenobacter hydrossis]|uniref:Phosphoesterase PA-phosphatase related protein n=1 Tax=Haliscomenobacter hydrossis (strain ATCC 27775 / DSM 1100 / LMG 10767 / O) TaxID=760192 RepID=F4L4Y5_HALH1|nr:phosphatase PAP2 family protein [Haliscomenobacter hydrossis]AEE54047.1 phosphoesterase PA-phosphatase related protein [Haliscomenobacter hydrossis DSM 1100]